MNKMRTLVSQPAKPSKQRDLKTDIGFHKTDALMSKVLTMIRDDVTLKESPAPPRIAVKTSLLNSHLPLSLSKALNQMKEQTHQLRMDQCFSLLLNQQEMQP